MSEPRKRIRKYRKRWPWEKLMANPPGRRTVVTEILMEHLDYENPKPVPEIHNDIVNDYGSFTERAVHRYLSRLVKSKKVIRVVEGDEYLGYVKVREKPKQRHTPSVSSVGR